MKKLNKTQTKQLCKKEKENTLKEIDEINGVKILLETKPTYKDYVNICSHIASVLGSGDSYDPSVLSCLQFVATIKYVTNINTDNMSDKQLFDLYMYSNLPKTVKDELPCKFNDDLNDFTTTISSYYSDVYSTATKKEIELAKIALEDYLTALNELDAEKINELDMDNMNAVLEKIKNGELEQAIKEIGKV